MRSGGRLRPGVLLQVAALLVVGGMYFANQDMGGDPLTPRGDGHYRPILARGDGHASYLMLRSLVLDGDLDLRNDFAMFSPIWTAGISAVGRPAIVHPIGRVLVWAPVFAAAHVGAVVADALGAAIARHGYTSWHQRIVFTTAPLLTFAACWMGARLARRLLGGVAADVAAVAVLLGTSATAYATYVPASSHPPDAAAHALFVLVWAQGFGDLRARRFALLGLLVGVAALIRVSGFGLAVALVVEAVVLLWRGDERGRLRLAARLAVGGAVTAVVAAVAFAPQMIAWHAVFGEWLLSPMAPGTWTCRARSWWSSRSRRATAGSRRRRWRMRGSWGCCWCRAARARWRRACWRWWGCSCG